MSGIGTRARAIEGLRAIAAHEAAVAAMIDEAGYYGEMAEVLRLSAADRREAASRLAGEREGSTPRLRLIAGGGSR